MIRNWLSWCASCGKWLGSDPLTAENRQTGKKYCNACFGRIAPRAQAVRDYLCAHPEVKSIELGPGEEPPK